jgi:hypothetical protein
LIAKTGLYDLVEATIVDCELKAGANTLDEDEVRIEGFNTSNDDNEFMDLVGTVEWAALLLGPPSPRDRCASG